ncbi:LolA family protein [Nonomuraea recticatena]|uniref:Sigma-E factor regulatory protein RseB domain-containing protein n=1 Tax=Nonomuraea recticatena TaxID=46178 RepID=A0ABP6DQB1_9ACTN
MSRGKLVRWGVPMAAVAVIGAAIGAGPVIAAVSGDPVLPERSAQQLLAEAAAAVQKDGLPPMSGTVLETASLGLPALPQTASAGSPIALLSGSHEAKVWYGSRDQFRLAVPGPMNETNVIVNGDQTWVWDSQSNTATRVKIAPGAEKTHTAAPTGPSMTPQQAAEQLLSKVGEHSVVSVTSNTQVAGRPAYELVLAPKEAGSLVQDVRLALDGETYVPLRVQVYAKGSAEPAFEVGFTQVTFSAPAPENFAFTPPAGAKVEEKTLGFSKDEEKHDFAEGEVKTVGAGWTTVAVLPTPKTPAAPSQGRSEGQGQAQEAAAALDTVLRSATPVSGAWGSGKLIKTKLVSALFTDDGRLLVGAVTPEELTKAAGAK